MLRIGDRYTCAECHETFTAMRDDEEAAAEANDMFMPEELCGPIAIVCEDCWLAMFPQMES